MSFRADLIETSAALPAYHLGPSLKLGKLPALFYFALSGKDSLELDPFNQPAAFLQNSPIRIFSFTIPGHGPDSKNSEAIASWAQAFSEGKNPIKEFIEGVNQSIEELIRLDLIDSEKMAAAGLSRGGFIATQLAASDSRIKAILGFAPMVQLELSEDFKKYQISEEVLNSSLNHLAEKLVGRSLRFYIGNRDILVHTDANYRFIRLLTEVNFNAGVRSPKVELIISPSIGTKGHGTPPHIFLNGVNWLKETLRIL